jgi:hypothetical protein
MLIYGKSLISTQSVVVVIIVVVVVVDMFFSSLRQLKKL